MTAQDNEDYNKKLDLCHNIIWNPMIFCLLDITFNGA